MENFDQKEAFRQALTGWFNAEKRDLPWRQTKDPYKIWVSEVMLQQTRVDTVIPYYERFIDAFPTIHDLANAPEDVLLKKWEGLGYYSRARNLQAGVREVVEQYNGIVPDNRPTISSLKGVGPYTAGAILSIAYGKPEHAVDGNVMRVLSRILLITEDIAKPKTRKIFEAAVTNLIDHEDPSSFNQGLMELGALICTPTSPKCLLCPVRDFCQAFHEGKERALPVKTKAKKTKEIQFLSLVIQNEQGKWLMEKRPKGGLLADMWQFPLVESLTDDVKNVYGIEKASLFLEFKHIFSHLTWNIKCMAAHSTKADDLSENCRWFSEEEMEELPLPVPMQKIKNEVMK
ncbi:A/G-specific adenine glycosylase [Chungangia koreensis]|uniref:Adenine DNA glycosylase n=1 Tax=Chungangia koreensis TaxID=752657 RepID=A0ABV8X2M7_9LACT